MNELLSMVLGKARSQNSIFAAEGLHPICDIGGTRVRAWLSTFGNSTALLLIIDALNSSKDLLKLDSRLRE